VDDKSQIRKTKLVDDKSQIRKTKLVDDKSQIRKTKLVDEIPHQNQRVKVVVADLLNKTNCHK